MRRLRRGNPRIRNLISAVSVAERVPALDIPVPEKQKKLTKTLARIFVRKNYEENGGRGRTRTCDPSNVNAVL